MSTDTPMLLLMKGHPGSGKSSLARFLAKRLGWALVDKDDARDCLAGLQAAAGGPELNALSYAIMWRVADTQLACSNSVVVDCPLARRQLYEAGLRIAQRHSACTLVVECDPRSEEVWRSRLEARGKLDATSWSSHKPCTWASLQLLIQGYNGLDKWSSDPDQAPEHHVVLDTTSSSLDDLAQLVELHIRDVLAQTRHR